MNNGWIKIHRSILNWEWYNDKNVRLTFLHLLLKANWEDAQWKGNLIKRGQVVIGTLETPNEIGISRQEFRTSINKLKLTNEITTTSTNKYTVVTIVKYEDYQEKENLSTNEQPPKQPTTNQQLTTSKEYKNIRSKEYNLVESFSEDVLNCYNSCLKFFSTTPSDKKTEKKWIETIEKLNRLDHLSFEDIVLLVEVVRKDDFWSKNFLSLTKLRRKDKDGIPYWRVFKEKFKIKKSNYQSTLDAYNQLNNE